MSWKAFGLTVVALAGLWSAVFFYISRPVSAPPRRLFVAYQGAEQYRVEADEFRIEGFCSVFYRGGVRFATVCGQHTVSEAVEVE